MGQLKEDLLRGILDGSSDGPNWIGFVEWIAEEFEEVIDAAIYIMVMTWLDTAEGIWLDRIGDLVGIRRPGNEELIRVFLCRGPSDPSYDPNHGFANPTGTIGGYLGGLWGVPADGLLDDAGYLDILKCKIAANNADASIPGVARYVFDAYGLSCTVTRIAQRQVRVSLGGSFDLRQRRFLRYFSPVLAGVDVVFNTFPSI